MLKKIFLIVFAISMCLISCSGLLNNNSSNTKLADRAPSYFLTELKDSQEKIEAAKVGTNGFLFITDTHWSNNRLGSPSLIAWLFENTDLNKIVWGGDAISAYGSDIESQWNAQEKLIEAVPVDCFLLNVRGNHDFTIQKDKSSPHQTYSQEQTAKLLRTGMDSSAVVRNLDDETGCYYYYDDSQNRIRYIVADTNDRLYTSQDGESTVGYGVGDIQLKWIRDKALMTTPDNYRVVFISHVPITDTTGSEWPYYSSLKAIVEDAKDKGVNVIMYVSGHLHQDMQTYQHGILHVLTASDAYYQDFTRDPFSDKSINRIERNANEQCIDCFLLKEDVVGAVRVGLGDDREFNLNPIYLNVGSCMSLSKNELGQCAWYSYDASGNVYKNDQWFLNNEVVKVDDYGRVTAFKKGEAVVMAKTQSGLREFWNIVVE